jgi:hypothetical protein
MTTHLALNLQENLRFGRVYTFVVFLTVLAVKIWLLLFHDILQIFAEHDISWNAVLSNYLPDNFIKTIKNNKLVCKKFLCV